METNTKFAKELDLDYSILSDPDGKVASAFGIYQAERKFASRVTFVIGKDGKILHVDTKVNAADHGKDIAAKLEDLGVDKK